MQVQALPDYQMGIENVLKYKSVKVDRSLKDSFHSALNKALIEKGIFFFSATITAFKNHYRFKRTG
jgi:hypothetical protein